MQRTVKEAEKLYKALPHGSSILDDETWSDLEMDCVFDMLNRTTSALGAQTLYYRLRVMPEDSHATERMGANYAVWRTDPDGSKYVRNELARLNSNFECRLTETLYYDENWGGRIDRLWVLGLVPLAFLFLSVWWKWLVVLAVVGFLVNTFVHHAISVYIESKFNGYKQLLTLIDVSNSICILKYRDRKADVETLRTTAVVRRKLRRRLIWVGLGSVGGGGVFSGIADLLNAMLLIDVMAYKICHSVVEEYRNELKEMMLTVGSIDADIAMSELLDGQEPVCHPIFVTRKVYLYDGLVHPLILKPIANSITIDGRSVLVTGPNMAGKTSFAKAVAINQILSVNLFIGFAERVMVPHVSVATLIKREDDIASGYSYYCKEIMRIREFTQYEPDGIGKLIIMDEILRGTNTTERIACSAALLRYLAERNCVIVTTHDLDLVDLLADQYETYNFTDGVVDGVYGYDYVLRRGMSVTRNAVKLLSIYEFPDSIVSEASRLVKGAHAPTGVNRTSQTKHGEDPRANK